MAQQFSTAVNPHLQGNYMWTITFIRSFWILWNFQEFKFKSKQIWTHFYLSDYLSCSNIGTSLPTVLFFFQAVCTHDSATQCHFVDIFNHHSTGQLKSPTIKDKQVIISTCSHQVVMSPDCVKPAQPNSEMTALPLTTTPLSWGPSTNLQLKLQRCPH